jgi:hypothetical protein
VSLFFASRVWSKVPRKGTIESGGGRAPIDYRAEVEEWEEPLHPGSLPRR